MDERGRRAWKIDITRGGGRKEKEREWTRY
jgi:hypothetical protein